MTRLAVVTGAAGGIGRAICRRLAADGCDIVAVDLSPTLADTAGEVEAVGRRVLPVQADLTTKAGRGAVVRAVDEAGGAVHALVNNAGITRDSRLVNMAAADFAAVLEVNLGVPFLLTTALAPRFAPGSAVVNVGSRSYLGNFGQFNYAMAKGGIVGLTRALALDLAPEVRVNAIAPGLTATAMVETIPGDVLGRMVAAIPLRRMARPEEMAAVVSFLCSEDASYLTGHVVVAGGGRSLS